MKEKIVTRQNVHKFSVEQLEGFLVRVKPSLPGLKKRARTLTAQAREVSSKADRLAFAVYLAEQKLRVERKKSQATTGTWYRDTRQCGKDVVRLVKFLSITKRGFIKAVDVVFNRSGMFCVGMIENGKIDDFTLQPMPKRDHQIIRVSEFTDKCETQGYRNRDNHFFKVDKEGKRFEEAFGDFYVTCDGVIRKEYPGVKYERCDMDPIMPDGIFR